MEQRGRSGQPVKGRRANRPKARKAPTTAPSIADLQMQVGTLTRESKEALGRQSATADILRVIASSPSDVQPVFEAIVGSAAKLFEPIAATITMVKDGKLHWGATAAVRPDFDVERTKTIYPIPFEPDRAASPRAILERRPLKQLHAMKLLQFRQNGSNARWKMCMKTCRSIAGNSTLRT